MTTEAEMIVSLKGDLDKLKQRGKDEKGVKYAQCNICRRVVYKGNARRYVDHYGDIRWVCQTCQETGRKE